jgi:hypothetical protein
MGNHVDDKKENLDMCGCPECPTHKNSPLAGALYCARGKAGEDVLEAGCNCSFCPVADKYDLTLEYYCVRGKSAEIP